MWFSEHSKICRLTQCSLFNHTHMYKYTHTPHTLLHFSNDATQTFEIMGVAHSCTHIYTHMKTTQWNTHANTYPWDMTHTNKYTDTTTTVYKPPAGQTQTQFKAQTHFEFCGLPFVSLLLEIRRNRILCRCLEIKQKTLFVRFLLFFRKVKPVTCAHPQDPNAANTCNDEQHVWKSIFLFELWLLANPLCWRSTFDSVVFDK